MFEGHGVAVDPAPLGRCLHHGELAADVVRRHGQARGALDRADQIAVAIAGPMEVWLAHRSLATLDVRLERQCGNALAIAALLQQHPAVAGVRYPGLPSDAANALAVRQMQRFGPVVGFRLADRAHADRFFARARLVIEATSFGGVHTSAERRARWGGDQVSEGFVRLSAGCEDPADLLEDIAQALG